MSLVKHMYSNSKCLFLQMLHSKQFIQCMHHGITFVQHFTNLAHIFIIIYISILDYSNLIQFLKIFWNTPRYVCTYVCSVLACVYSIILHLDVHNHIDVIITMHIDFLWRLRDTTIAIIHKLYTAADNCT